MIKGAKTRVKPEEGRIDTAFVPLLRTVGGPATPMIHH